MTPRTQPLQEQTRRLLSSIDAHDAIAASQQLSMLAGTDGLAVPTRWPESDVDDGKSLGPSVGKFPLDASILDAKRLHYTGRRSTRQTPTGAVMAESSSFRALSYESN